MEASGAEASARQQQARGKCRVIIWTHKIDGLAQADFIFAAKVDALR